MIGIKNQTVKRSLRIAYNDDTPDKELEVGKAAVVHSDKEFIYFEKMPDGQWRLTFSSLTVSDFSKIDCFKMIREDDVPLHVRHAQETIDSWPDWKKDIYYKLLEAQDLLQKSEEVD